jgi:uncharacterized membrane protein
LRDEEAEGTSPEGVGDSNRDSFDQHPADYRVLERREDAAPNAGQGVEEGRGAAQRSDEPNRHFSQSLRYSHTEQYQLAIPPPEMLARYEQVWPGSVERIIAMAEAETYRSHDRDDRQVATAAKLMQRGQWIGAVVAACGLVGSGLGFSVFDNNVAGGVFLGVPVLMLVRSFTST